MVYFIFRACVLSEDLGVSLLHNIKQAMQHGLENPKQ